MLGKTANLVFSYRYIHTSKNYYECTEMEGPLTELDCDVPLQLVFKTHRLYARDGLHHRRFSVGYMTDGANVDGGLSRDHLRRERR